MGADPKCIACNVQRDLISITPIVNGHGMQSFECPKCKSVFRLVIQRESNLLPDAVFA